MVDELPTSTGEFTGFLVAINSILPQPALPKIGARGSGSSTQLEVRGTACSGMGSTCILLEEPLDWQRFERRVFDRFLPQSSYSDHQHSTAIFSLKPQRSKAEKSLTFTFHHWYAA